MLICTFIGAVEKDYALLENSEVIKAGEMLEHPGEGTESFGKVEFVRVRPKSDKNSNTSKKDSADEQAEVVIAIETAAVEENAKEADEKIAGDTKNGANEPLGNIQEIKVRQALPGAPQRLHDDGSVTSVKANINNNNLQPSFSKPINPILGTKNRQDPPMSSIGPTMWMGDQEGWLYVHSAVGRWHECLHKVLLPDAVLAIVHVESRVVVALANAQLAVFRRQTDGQWDLNSYHLVTLGERNHSIRCLCVAGERIWAAHRNKIYIVDPISLSIVHSLEAHPRKESQVRQMAATGAGVWVSIR